MINVGRNNHFCCCQKTFNLERFLFLIWLNNDDNTFVAKTKFVFLLNLCRTFSFAVTKVSFYLYRDSCYYSCSGCSCLASWIENSIYATSKWKDKYFVRITQVLNNKKLSTWLLFRILVNNSMNDVNCHISVTVSSFYLIFINWFLGV